MKSSDRPTESPIHTIFRIRILRYKTSHHCEQKVYKEMKVVTHKI